MMLLAAAAALLLQPPTAAASYAVSDAGGVGRVFEGVGAISGGGATSRLLLDYEDPFRAQVLDYLFLPNFGASLQILKVEIGGSCDSTNGAEAPHRYTADEAPSFTRGYEWWLLGEALARNPAIRVYGLPWCFPAYIGNGTQNPFGPGTAGGAAAAAFVTEWAVAARDLYNATPWALGLFNEKPSTPDYILNLRSALDAAGLTSTHLVASDEGGWPGAAQVLGNASVAAAVGLLGSHYPGSSSSAQALATGLPLLASEDNSRSSLPGSNGGACWARVINENVAHGNLTGSISWSLINSWYSGIQFYGDGLMSAVQPWSGSYYVGAPIWATAHTSHHAFPGWRYLQRGAGVGYLAGGGTYATLLSPSAADATIVIEKLDRAASQCSWSSSPHNATSPETATFTLGGSLARITSLYVYRSSFDATGAADPAAMYASQGTLAVVGGTFSISVAVNDVITLSTVQGAKGAHAPPPAPAPFPSPYAPNLTDVPLAQEPKYLSDMIGNFEVVPGAPYGRPASRVLRQMTPAKPILWLRKDTTPHAIVGDPAWGDTNASVQAYLPAPGDTAALGIHCFGLDVDATACAWLRIAAAGAGSASGSWALYVNARDMANASVQPRLSGALPGVLAGAWHSLALASVAGNVSASVNGRLVAAGLSAGSLGSGTGFVGLGVAAYGHMTAFDALSVSAAAAPSPTPPPPPPSCEALLQRLSSSSGGGALGGAAAAAPCVPAAGSLLQTSPCGSAGNGLAWVWRSSSGSGSGGGAMGTLSPASAPALCAAVNASRPNKQTGAPQVELQACSAGVDAAQQWQAPPAHTQPPRAIAGDRGALEVTKNELGAGVPLEVWGSNGGANQQWCALKSGELFSLLDAAAPMCIGACGAAQG